MRISIVNVLSLILEVFDQNLFLIARFADHFLNSFIELVIVDVYVFSLIDVSDVQPALPPSLVLFEELSKLSWLQIIETDKNLFHVLHGDLLLDIV